VKGLALRGPQPSSRNFEGVWSLGLQLNAKNSKRALGPQKGQVTKVSHSESTEIPDDARISLPCAGGKIRALRRTIAGLYSRFALKAVQPEVFHRRN